METTVRDLFNFTEEIDNTDSVLLKDLLEFLLGEKKFNLKEVVTSQEFQEYYKKVNQERQNKKESEKEVIEEGTEEEIFLSRKQKKIINLVKDFFNETFLNCCNLYYTKGEIIIMMCKAKEIKESDVSFAINYLIKIKHLIEFKERNFHDKNNFKQVNLRKNIELK